MTNADKIMLEANIQQGKTRDVLVYLKLIRPKQWVKNLFIFAPLIFAKELFQFGPVVTSVIAFIAFCLTASAVYIVNDILDVAADRAHPEKRFRPLAAKAVSFVEAYILLGTLLACVGMLAYGMDSRFVVILCAYFLLNLAYSLKLKDVVLLDVFIIAAGFMMRVLGGAYAIKVETSTWLVLCTLFISLFLGFAKRRSELVQIPHSTFTERKVLERYRVVFLDQMLTIAAAGAVISYALYTVAPRTQQVFGTDKLIYSTVFVIYGVFRYLYLIHTTTSTDKPADVVTSDVAILGTVLLWVLTCVSLIYFRV
ncbi:MAG: decaprenyl-phosphate phosphoribosyltransferase [Bacteroidota bacterium]